MPKRKNDDIVFRRIRGRIVPIKRKKKDSLAAEPVKGSAKIAGGLLAGILGSKSASKDLSKSFKLFKQSAELRGASRLAAKGSQASNKLLRAAAKSKLKGIKSRKIARTKFGLAAGITSFVVGSGATDFFDQRNELGDEIGGVIATGATAAVVGLTAKKFKIRASTVSDLFSGFSKRGTGLSRAKIKRISKTAYDPKRPKRGGQLSFDI